MFRTLKIIFKLLKFRILFIIQRKQKDSIKATKKLIDDDSNPERKIEIKIHTINNRKTNTLIIFDGFVFIFCIF